MADTTTLDAAAAREPVDRRFAGRLFVAPVTPFRGPDLEVDEDGYRALLGRFAAEGTPERPVGLIAAPEAGEIHYLERHEKRRLLEIALEVAGDDVPVLMGISENRTADAAAAAREAAAMGADGLFSMPPVGALDVTAAWDPVRYPEVYVDLLHELTRAAPGLPIACHATCRPSPQFGVGLPVEAAVEVCRRVPEIVAWKMTYSYNGYRTVARQLRALDRPVALYASSAPFFHEYLAGELMDGMLTGALNYADDLILDHVAAWQRGDLAEARRLWNGGLAALHEYVYADHARLHIRYKVATWLRGAIASPAMRPPMPPPLREEVDLLARLLRACGADTISEDEIRGYADALRR